ncbi:MAG: response regulator [Lachnospiraceae bacterium]|nr:response regulator [Lachnospiraceae bacterium]
MYLLRVHSLKSTARLIGAVSVAERATDLEYAGAQQEYALVHALTPPLLDEYKSMLPCLEKLLSEEEAPPRHTERTILFIGDEPGIVGRGITKALEDEGFEVISIPDVPEVILNHRAESDILIYYPAGDDDHIKVISTMLAEMCRDDGKTLCLEGDPLDMATARDIHGSEYIASVYPRPINLAKMASDMSAYYDKYTESDRVRTVLVIDDDPDFLHIMEHWLSSAYNVDCSHSGASALAYLDRKRPDLILLDYEMPGMDGDQIMRRIRSNPANGRIPIIFLTGINDKDRVMKVLGHRPDGYLLKSMPREALLESLQEFFAEGSASSSISFSN